MNITESNRIEYKSKLTDNFEKEISAFLNYKDAGIVYIGIDSNGEKDLALVEHLGSGLNRILTAYGKESFEVRNNFMRNIFYKNITKIQDNEGINDPVNKILELLYKNNTLSYDDLALALNKSKATVKRKIQKLKLAGLIKRIGSDKSGYWEILNG